MYTSGQKIKELRTKRKLSQDELAELSNLHRVTIAKYESGTVEPSASAIKRIAEALDVSTDYLLDIQSYNGNGTIESIMPKEALQLAVSISNDPRLFKLMATALNATPEEKQAATAMLYSFQLQRTESVKA